MNKSNNKQLSRLDRLSKFDDKQPISVINFIDQINKEFNGTMEFNTDILINAILQNLKKDNILDSELQRLKINNPDNLTNDDKAKILNLTNVMVD